MARVFVITGPSGVGKGTLIRGLMRRFPELELSVSATTRLPRVRSMLTCELFLSVAKLDSSRKRSISPS